MTPEQREAKRAANKEAWKTHPANANAAWMQRQAELKAATSIKLPEIAADQPETGAMGRLRKVMLDPAEPLYRRIDAADAILSYELAPGGAIDVPADQIAATSYLFLKAVSEDADTPEALRMRADKLLLAVENRRRSASTDGPAQHHASREFWRAMINAERREALREAGVWHRVVDLDETWALHVNDSFDLPEVPELDVGTSISKAGFGDYLDALKRVPKEVKDAYHEERRAVLLSVRAKNRPDNWENLLVAARH
jgi:hypothetical protein